MCSVWSVRGSVRRLRNRHLAAGEGRGMRGARPHPGPVPAQRGRGAQQLAPGHPDAVEVVFVYVFCLPLN